MRPLLVGVLPLIIIFLPCILYIVYRQKIKTKVLLKINIAGILFLVL